MTTIERLKLAGRELAVRLVSRGYARTLVLAIPRRGAIVGRSVALGLIAPMDLALASKVAVGDDGLERRIGAIALPDVRVDGPGASVLPQDDRDAVFASAFAELHRRLPILRGDAPLPDLAGRTVIVVDDVAITGETMQAAIASIRARRPARIVAAVARSTPVATDRLAHHADELVVLETIPIAGAAEAHDAEGARICPPLDDRELGEMARETQRLARVSLYNHLELDGIAAGDA
jgi:predicted phosphoribosyltransferase